METNKVNLNELDIEIVKELYLQHHHGDCFNELFKTSLSGDKILKVHSAIDVNGFFQFAAHEYNPNEYNPDHYKFEISWNKKTDECIRFYR